MCSFSFVSARAWEPSDARGGSKVTRSRARAQFLGYDARRYEALCDAAVQANARATVAAVNGVATRKGTQQAKHGVSSASASELQGVLSCKEVRALSDQFWATLPAALQKHWRGWLRPNCAGSLANETDTSPAD